MCGIFAYTGRGEKNASSVLLEGLSSLEYRGYDSAGVCTPEGGVVRAKGAVQELRKKMPEAIPGRSGIAHLRWATHGEPVEKNAHPHADCTGDVHVVHNGIVENFHELKEELLRAGHAFSSDTDTEVLAHLIEDALKTENDIEKAVLAALRRVRGTYGLAVQYAKDPERIVAARLGSPLVIGLGKEENFIASDPSPILKHTRTVVFLEDGEVASITPFSHTIYKLNASPVFRTPEELDWSAEDAQKGGFEHFMLKEIFEGPEAIRNTLRGRLIPDKGRVKLGGLESVAEEIKQVERIIIVACGTAYYAGLTGEYLFEGHAHLPVEVEFASEFRYRSPVVNEKTAVLAVSQSGETADTLEAIREGKRKGALTLGIVNAVGSTIARETDAGIYNHAGPEIGVASTKAFISQLTALSLLTVFLGRERGMSEEEGKRIVSALEALPEKLASILARKDEIRALAQKYANMRDFLFMGRKHNYPTAFEGALKLKEISYIHAEGCGAGEMKHGPIAMIDEQFPTIAITPQDSVYEKNISNIQEIRARKGPIIAVATEGDERIRTLADDVIFIPETLDMLTPILAVAPLHLFSYYVALEKGLNPDRPRNLAKSVTVE